jgi:hypothetical protein
MNWDAIGAIGEAFGAIALFLVLVQVRHAREEVRRSVSQSRLDALQQRATQFVDKEHLNALNMRAITALGGGSTPFINQLVERIGMTGEEASTLSWHEAAWWLGRVQVIAQVEHMPPDERVEFDNATRWYYRHNPLSSLWYTETKATLPNRVAVRYVDNLPAQPD